MYKKAIKYEELYYEDYFDENVAKERKAALEKRYEFVHMDSFQEKNGWFRKRTCYRITVYVRVR